MKTGNFQLNDDGTISGKWSEIIVGPPPPLTTTAAILAALKPGAVIDIAPLVYDWPNMVTLPAGVTLRGKALFRLTGQGFTLADDCAVRGLNFTYPDNTITAAYQPEIFILPAGAERVSIINNDAPLCGNFIHGIAGAKSRRIIVNGNTAVCAAYFAWEEDGADWTFSNNFVRRFPTFVKKVGKNDKGEDVEIDEETGGQNLIRFYRVDGITLDQMDMAQGKKSCVKAGSGSRVKFQRCKFSGGATGVALGGNYNDFPPLPGLPDPFLDGVEITDCDFDNATIDIRGATDNLNIHSTRHKNTPGWAINLLTQPELWPAGYKLPIGKVHIEDAMIAASGQWGTCIGMRTDQIKMLELVKNHLSFTDPGQRCYEFIYRDFPWTSTGDVLSWDKGSAVILDNRNWSEGEFRALANVKP